MFAKHMRHSDSSLMLKLPAANGENIIKARMSIRASTEMASPLKCHNTYASVTWVKIAEVKSMKCRRDASPLTPQTLAP